MVGNCTLLQLIYFIRARRKHVSIIEKQTRVLFVLMQYEYKKEKLNPSLPSKIRHERICFKQQ